jgi:single-stranded-DNA-specific exonuclease
MAKRWRIHPHDPDRIASLGRAAQVPAVVAQLLLCRGITDPDTARVFLDPKLTALRDPELLPGCAEAAERIHAAIAAGRHIVVYGDYDVDGMTGTALLWRCLRLLGTEPSYYVPHRMDEGYGLNAEAIRSLAEQGAGMIVTVDCGICSVAEADLVRELGVELVVSDHHQPGPELPQAAAIVHPALPGRPYPFPGLSGSGVAMKLAWALCQQASGAKRVKPQMREFLLQAVGLAALGTVADVVPLLDENRVLVHYGLASLTAQPTPGITALLRVAQLERKRQLDSEDIAFSLAPRLNAAGRLGQPRLGVELLVTERAERAQELAVYINQLNETRKTLERSILLAANKQVKEHYDPAEEAALVLAERGWHQGVIGIVAGRLAEKYHRPVVLISRDQMGIKPGVGSARSVPGFDVCAALGSCCDYLISCGGHAAAAGLRIEEVNIESFRAAFCETARAAIRSENRVAELRIDAEAPLSAFTLKAVRQIERLAPFGKDNDRPLLCASGAAVAEAPRTIGTGDRHLALKLEQDGVTLRTVAFGGGDWAEELTGLDGPIDVAFRPVINQFRGRQNVELHLVDWRRTTS